MKWNIDSDRPVYIQLIEQIQLRVMSGYYKPTSRLPSVRDMASEIGVNPNTMQRAMAELERTGLIYSNRTSGRYITSDLELIKKLKEEYANSIIKDFLEKMKQIGFDEEEIMKMIRESIKEMRK